MILARGGSSSANATGALAELVEANATGALAELVEANATAPTIC